MNNELLQPLLSMGDDHTHQWKYFSAMSMMAIRFYDLDFKFYSEWYEIFQAFSDVSAAMELHDEICPSIMDEWDEPSELRSAA